MKTNNADVREAIHKAGLRQWQVAMSFGIHEGNFSRMLRKELDEKTKKQIFSIIDTLQKEAELEQIACV